jgi:hypothetical protein
MNEQPELKRVRLSSQIRHRAVGDEGVLVHLANARVLVVNEVGLHIVSQLGSPRTREELTASIADAFDTSPNQAAADLETYLAELDAEQALEYL